MLVSAVFASGAPFSVHYRGGMSRTSPGLIWDIHGNRGDLRVTGPTGHAQLVPLTVEGAAAEEKALRPIDVPASLLEGFAALNAVSGNVARIYARNARIAADLREGTRTAPSFDDGLALHRLLDAIEVSAAIGRRV